MGSKPRWVECADEAAQVLERAAGSHSLEEQTGLINEAHGWMRLADIFRDGKSSENEGYIELNDQMQRCIRGLNEEIKKVRDLAEDDQYAGAQVLAELASYLILQITNQQKEH